MCVHTHGRVYTRTRRRTRHCRVLARWVQGVCTHAWACVHTHTHTHTHCRVLARWVTAPCYTQQPMTEPAYAGVVRGTHWYTCVCTRVTICVVAFVWFFAEHVHFWGMALGDRLCKRLPDSDWQPMHYRYAGAVRVCVFSCVYLRVRICACALARACVRP